MATRRRFLSILGVGAISAPIAAKEAADAEVLKLTGITSNTIASGTGLSEAAADIRHSSKDELSRCENASKYLMRYSKLPDHVEANIRDNARYVNYLDYDIASKRSWSLAVKVQEQRQRNYERNLARYREGNSYDLAQKAFEAVSGFKWPW